MVQKQRIAAFLRMLADEVERDVVVGIEGLGWQGADASGASAVVGSLTYRDCARLDLVRGARDSMQAEADD